MKQLSSYELAACLQDRSNVSLTSEASIWRSYIQSSMQNSPFYTLHDANGVCCWLHRFHGVTHSLFHLKNSCKVRNISGSKIGSLRYNFPVAMD
jgi:hypothetical protein